jgi:hypothetical protein
MPLIGNMSDKYGRKALLTVPMSLIIVPSGKHVLHVSLDSRRFSMNDRAVIQ